MPCPTEQWKGCSYNPQKMFPPALSSRIHHSALSIKPPLVLPHNLQQIKSRITLPSFSHRKMSSDSAETRRLTKPHTPGAPPPEQEQLPCPRCNSPNTKFCYYNNYNLSQPRHFCKSCRRYWTHGGTLRDIPVGGGTRKNAKRSRTVISGSSTPVVITTATSNTGHSLPFPATPILVPLTANQGAFGVGGGSDFDVKGNGTGGMCGSFTSLLNTQGPGFLALGGFGLGFGSGFEDVSFGPGRGVWPFTGVGDGAAGLGSNGVAATGMGSTWQFESGETGFVGGDCFSWPDLAISTPANGVK